VAVIKLPAIAQKDRHSKIASDSCLLVSTAKFREQTSVLITALLEKQPMEVSSKTIIYPICKYNDRKI
jgi:hypothetical protein